MTIRKEAHIVTRSLAMKLRVLRAERQLSLRQASTLTGVDKVSLSRFERGIAHPQDRTLGKLAAGYGVPVEELLEEPVEYAGKAEAPREAGRPEWDDTAVHNARQLREHGWQRMEELLSSWRASKERGDSLEARRGYLDEMGALLQRAYDAVMALWRALRTDRLNLVDLDEFSELQAADRFYVDLWRMVQRAEGLRIRTDAEETTGTPETVNAGDSPPAERPEEVVELVAA